VKAAAGACAGAALALLLVTTVETWQVLVAVLVAVVLATVLVKDEVKVKVNPVAEPAPAQAPPAQAKPSWPENPGAPQLRVVLDAPASGQWWTKTNQAPPRPNGESPRQATQARDLTGYVETARVVQCPQCGSFHIDVTRLASGYSFRCRTGDHAWQWQPGRAWPATVVVSRRRNS
jgi:hypothetical protein